MLIITWILFVIMSAASIGFTFLAFVILSDRDEQDTPPFVILINYVFIILTFFISKDLFSPITSISLWKIANISYLFLFLVCSIYYFKKIKLTWTLTIIGAILLTSLPFLINITVINKPFSITNLFNNEYPQLIFNFWIPLIIVLISIILSFGFILNPVRAERNRLLTLLSERGIDSLNTSKKSNNNIAERYYVSDIEDKLIRNLIEEVQYRLDRNLKMNEDLYFRLRNSVEQISEIGRLQNRPPLQNEKSIAKFEKILLEVTDKLDIITKNENSQKIGLYSNPNNQNFIRELYHFLITPLSQIETKTILYSQSSNLIAPDKFSKDVLTIKTSVEICKSVLAAYRELAFITTSSDWSPESLNQSTIAACHMYIDGNGKEIILDCHLNANYPPYSNNYLLALLLPLIENAIKASPQNKKVAIVSEIKNSILTIVITNEAIAMPTIEQLNTTGFSSKPRHVGTGLLIARHLIEDQNAGVLEFSLEKNIIKTTITLPNQKS